MSDIKPFLAQCVAMMRNNPMQAELPYCSPMDVVLQHGRHWEAFSATQWSRGEPQQCFANAQRLALLHPQLTYVEGYAMSVIPLHHGWCVDAEGRVVDPTWSDEPREYFGVPILTRYVRKLALASGHWSALFDNWTVEPPQPIITGRHKPASWLKAWPA
jgi:hypothetical protein